MRERTIQIVLPAVLLLSLAMPTASRAADGGATESSAAHHVPPTPLAQLLNPDYTLNLGSGFSGSLDARGWAMHMDSNGSPRFVPAAQSGPTSVPDDAAWDSRFGLPGVDGAVSTIAISGTNVFVGGWFTQAGNLWANGIARWDGKNWSVLGNGLQLLDDDPTTQRFVAAIVISGTDVYAGGLFNRAGDVEAHNIARWDGQAWHALGSGPGNGVDGQVHAIAIIGSNVYAGGFFRTAGGSSANNIARWDGAAWSSLGGGATNGVNAGVQALASNRNALYVGGSFDTAGGISANGIARWDGASWSDVGGGVSQRNNFRIHSVVAIAVSESTIYIGGTFDKAGDVEAINVARWDGRAWSALGSGITANLDATAVNTLAISGTEVYVGGSFTYVGDQSISNIARWDGSAWHPFGDESGIRPINPILTIAVAGHGIYAGNTLAYGQQGNVAVLRWSQNTWNLLGSPVANGVGGMLATIAISGTDVFVGGAFTSVGSLQANNIARWDGSAWHTLGSGPNNGTDDTVHTLAVMGQDVYAGGDFRKAGGVDVNYLARWDGATWSAVGSTGANGVGARVAALAVSSSDLYVGGDFDQIGGLVVNGIARWDGAAWHALGSGATSGVEAAGWVEAITVLGDSIYVGGVFLVAGTVSARNIARWDGSTWHALGDQVANGVDNNVLALAAQGTDLYVGGFFTTAGAVSANYVARWDGSTWHALGSGATNGANGPVAALAISGDDLYVGGRFDSTGGVNASNIARWRRASNAWATLGSGVAYRPVGVWLVSTLGLNGSDLYVGGELNAAGGRPSWGIGRWSTRPLRHVFLPSVSS
jgi:hypothetical protein